MARFFFKKEHVLTGTKADWLLLRFPIVSDGNSKVFRYTKRFRVAQVGGDEKCSSRGDAGLVAGGDREEAGRRFKSPPRT